MLFEEIKKSNSVKSNLVYIEKDINKAIEKISSIIKNKGKLLFCGNGGSAADAQRLNVNKTKDKYCKISRNFTRYGYKHNHSM